MSSSKTDEFDDAPLIRTILAESIRRCPKTREQIVEELSALLGHRITWHMLNNYTAESKQTFRWPAAWDRAFCQVVSNWDLVRQRFARSGFTLITQRQLKVLRLGELIIAGEVERAAAAALKEEILRDEEISVRAEESSLVEAQGGTAALRVAVLAPLEEYRRRSKKQPHRKPIRLADGREFRNLLLLVADQAAKYGVSARTIWRWDTRQRDFGVLGLSRRSRRDRGVSRFFEAHPKATEFVLRQSGFHSVQELRREMASNWAMFSNGYKDHPPSLWAIRSFLRNVSRVAD